MTKNAIDMDEYPRTTEMQQRCVNMLGHLYHAPLKPGEEATGTATIGSSEACMLVRTCDHMSCKWCILERSLVGYLSTIYTC